MKSNYLNYYGLRVLLLGGLAVGANAAITGVSLGTGAPPATLGGYSMIGFPADASADGDTVSGVTDPYGRTVGFSQDLTHDIIGGGWLTWSHGYTGDVYDTSGSLTDPTTVTISLPADVHAFYLYAEPAQWFDFTIAATAQDGTTVSEIVNGFGGANGYGFYGDIISSITLTTTDSDGFAIGEFAIDRTTGVPDAGATWAALGLAFVSLVGGKRLLPAKRECQA